MPFYHIKAASVTLKVIQQTAKTMICTTDYCIPSGYWPYQATQLKYLYSELLI